jgi:hypothetical protein
MAQASVRLPEVYLEGLCFQAQQAAEKAIKAVFITRKTPGGEGTPRRTGWLEAPGEPRGAANKARVVS